MPIPSSINDLSTTAGSNSPAGSESPSLIDDYLRTYASYIALLRDGAQSNSFNFAAGGGSANAITATYSPAITVLSDSTVLLVKAAAPNTGATTFSPNGLTAKPVVSLAHTALLGGEIVANGEICLQYNSSVGGGSWILVYSSGGALAVQQQQTTSKNLFLNPVGAVNQRGYVSGTATIAANQFTIDRMKVVVSGQNLTFTASGIGFIMTAPAGGVEQVLEGSTIEGGVYTLSWTGTATAAVNGAAVTNRGQTASLTAGSNVTIRFTGGTFTAVQFELGLIATPIEKRIYANELFLCRRYARQHQLNAFGYVQSGFGAQDITLSLEPPMRATPTITIISPITIFDGTNGGRTITGVTANNSVDSAIKFQPVIAGGAFPTASFPLITYGGSVLISADI
ncbi:hypothetical protein KVG88_06295 [Pseudomonas sp. SWRI74]|uniref:Phage tail protein n=1 Tax=Pseudomonas azerbaijanoccidentalis TaxID=2842347 RepID=A0ABS6QL36_9PSED|nr:hypothetical protein [Pseudomonas azerbaijanoccidentalis]MBV4519667.1 hypothetical protein [Pseudomonas azerbaijanoccidentalis]